MKKYMKANRAYTPIRKYGWIFTVLVAIGGLWVPKLGLLVVLIMAGLTATSFFTGRYWCGNMCPHGSLFDVIMLPLSKNKKIPNFFYSKAMISLFFVFFMFNFVRRIIAVIPFWGKYDFLDQLGMVFSTTYLMVMIVGGLLAITVNPRTWCQFCPMGTLQKLSYKLGTLVGATKKIEKKVTISDENKCISCAKCEKVCPVQLAPYLDFSDKNQFNNVDCIKCGVCTQNCPINLLSLATEEEGLALKEKSKIGNA